MQQHTHANFVMLMQAFRVPIKENCSINASFKIEGHERDLTLFTGVDYYARRFVNIPIRVTFHDGVSVFKPIVVYQVSPHADLFRVSAGLQFDASWDALLKQDRYASEMDFLKLSILLSGHDVEIYEGLPTEENRLVVDNPELYVTLRLYNLVLY